MQYKELNLDDYFTQGEEPADLETVAEATLPEEEPEVDEAGMSQKFGVNSIMSSEELEALRQSIVDEMQAYKTMSEKAQKAARL